MTEAISESFNHVSAERPVLAPEEGTIEADPIIARTGEDRPAEVALEDVSEAELEELTAPDDDEPESEDETESEDED